MSILLDDAGRLYKGALHLHTTRSDGRQTPEQVAAMYRQAGCDFLAFADHWVVGDGGEIEGMLLVSGCEYNIGNVKDTPVHHILGLGMARTPTLPYDEQMPPKTVIDAISGAGGIAVLAHPAWSMADPDCMEGMEGLAAVEIYNTVSGLPNNTRADSSAYVDIWAMRGRYLPCIATDDFHGVCPGDGPCSYTMFYTDTLNRDAVLKAVRTGACFGSQGPVFGRITQEDGVITARFSEVEQVIFHTNTPGGDGKVFFGPQTGAQYHIQPNDRFVRMELVDAGGRRAWTMPWPVNVG